MTLTAAYNGAPVDLAGILGRVDDLYASRKTLISLEGRLNEAKLAINGSFGPFTPKPNAQVDLLLKADTIATFGQFAGIELPDIHGLDMTLTALANEGTFAAQDIRILVNDAALNLNIAGNIENLSDVAGIELTTEARLEHLDTVLEQLEITSPVVVPASLAIKGAITGSLEELALDSLDAVLKDDGVTVNINGKVKNLLAPAGVDISLTATADTIERITKFAGTEIPDIGTLDLKGRILSKGQQVRLDSMDIKLHGEVIDAQVEAVVDDLMALAKTTAHPGKYDSAGVRVSLRADTASISQLALATNYTVDGNVVVTLDQGVLTLGPLDLQGQSGGAGESLIIIDASNPEVNLDVKMKFDNFVSPRFGGNFDLDVNPDGHGESIAAGWAA